MECSIKIFRHIEVGRGLSLPLSVFPAANVCSDPSVRQLCHLGSYHAGNTTKEMPCETGYIYANISIQTACSGCSYCQANSTVFLCHQRGSRFCREPIACTEVAQIAKHRRYFRMRSHSRWRALWSSRLIATDCTMDRAWRTLMTYKSDA